MIGRLQFTKVAIILAFVLSSVILSQTERPESNLKCKQNNVQPNSPTCGEYSLGDLVWHDANVNGIQDQGEEGIAGVIVQLCYDNNIVATTVTDANGHYLFEHLTDGDYGVKIADDNFQAGGVFENSSNDIWYATYQDAGGDDELDSDGDVDDHNVCVTMNNDNLSVDFGFFHTAVTLEKTGPQSVDVGDDITYHFVVHNTGDLVLHGGCHVYDPLINPNGNHQIWQAVVHPGETVEFDRQYTTTQNDCGQLTNTAQVVGHPKMPDGSYKPDVEMSDSWTTQVNCNTGSIGDKVWYDDNENGIQDVGEGGAENVTVRLYDCATDALIAATVTAANGEYHLNNISAGNYYLKFELPSGYAFTLKDIGSDDEKDSDVDVNTEKTDCFAFTQNEHTNRFDAGLVCNPVADLSLEKTVDNPNPENGDIVEFTITVNNDGPNDAPGVQVTDLLPDGLLLLDWLASQGSYHATSGNGAGYWDLGCFPSNSTATLTLRARVNVDSCNTSSFDLGPATGYNVFVFGDMIQPSSDTEGKVAVGGNANFSNYSIGNMLTTNGEDVLIVGGNLQFTSGAVYHGNVVYGGTTNLPVSTVSITDGTLRLDNPIDFNAAETYLRNLSSQLNCYTVTDTTAFEWGGLSLNGSNPLLNVFEVDGNELSQANNVQINVPNGAVVLVNVHGQNVSWTGGLTVTGTDVSNVLYNFPEAQTLTIQGIDLRGTVLAPYADVNFISGVQHGQMIAKSIGVTGQNNTGQFNNNLFVGNIPCHTTLTNVAEISASNAQDPDSTPGNGDPNEDDYDSVVLNIGSNNNGGGNGGNGGNQNWELVNQIGNELIWTMTYDNSGNALYGTWGGNVYRSENGNNTIINQGMNVGYIWSIAVDPVNDKIWVATENGVYISRDNGASWELRGLAGKDVRAIIAVGEDHVWAGTWGSGVYELSQATGYQFVERNDDLTFTAVHALAVNSNGDIYAGTFGGGVMKLEGGSGSWEATSIPYSYVWALGVDSNDKIYAGTYGGGVYVSDDNGGSWTSVNNGLANNYIYSITVNPSDEVFASAWGAGVYKLNTSKDLAWSELGMSGFNVTSVTTGADGYVYAATEDGMIYKYTDKPLTVDDDTPVEKFDLLQNYPNPFNPTTNIKFTIAKQGNYKLVVYNLLGEKVATLVNGTINKGSHEIMFNASRLSSGIYVYSLQGEGLKITKKMVLMK